MIKKIAIAGLLLFSSSAFSGSYFGISISGENGYLSYSNHSHSHIHYTHSSRHHGHSHDHGHKHYYSNGYVEHISDHGGRHKREHIGKYGSHHHH
jgi:hypothetical protein